MGSQLQSRRSVTRKVLQHTDLLKRLNSIERLEPKAGFALQFTDYDGQSFVLANSKMPEPAHDTEIFPTATTIVSLDQGVSYASIRLLVNGATGGAQSGSRAALIGAALDVAYFLDHRGAMDRAA